MFGILQARRAMETVKLYISIIALVVSVVALSINYFTSRSRDVATFVPVCVFEYHRDAGWHIHNVGSGPALDVIFARSNQKAVHDDTRLPAIAKDKEFLLHFAKRDNLHTFSATYRDVEGRPYTSRSSED